MAALPAMRARGEAVARVHGRQAVGTRSGALELPLWLGAQVQRVSPRAARQRPGTRRRGLRSPRDPSSVEGVERRRLSPRLRLERLDVHTHARRLAAKAVDCRALSLFDSSYGLAQLGRQLVERGIHLAAAAHDVRARAASRAAAALQRLLTLTQQLARGGLLLLRPARDHAELVVRIVATKHVARRAPIDIAVKVGVDGVVCREVLRARHVRRCGRVCVRATAAATAAAAPSAATADAVPRRTNAAAGTRARQHVV
mmetsp:Transcript_2269/g.9042  ORF Transcript_2269/g.9042 Transcript_2269/m.9042 type:complete len:257 (-) Transcript_2269:27-797(-)